MIKLNVKPYCHGCPKFGPETLSYYDWDDNIIEQEVVCEHRDECIRIERYIRESIERKEK